MGKLFDYDKFPTWINLAVGEVKEMEPLTDVNLMAPKGSVLRYIRGERCKNEKSTLQEFAAALQFPYYFGTNWDAFDECMSDLSWLPGEGYIIVITRAEAILAEDEKNFRILVDVLKYAADYWAKEKKQFKVVFNVAPYNVERMQARLETITEFKVHTVKLTK